MASGKVQPAPFIHCSHKDIQTFEAARVHENSARQVMNEVRRSKFDVNGGSCPRKQNKSQNVGLRSKLDPMSLEHAHHIHMPDTGCC